MTSMKLELKQTPGFMATPPPSPDDPKAPKVECPCRKCMHQVHITQVCQHMMDKHAKTSVFTARDSDTYNCRVPINIGRVNGPHNSFDHSWIFDGNRFIARIQQVFPTWYAWVWVLAGKAEAEKYFCRIVAISADENQDFKLRTSYVGPIHSIEVSKKDVRNKSAACFQLTDQIVELYKSDNVSEKEKENGFNAALILQYTVWRRNKGSKEGQEIMNSSTGNKIH